MQILNDGELLKRKDSIRIVFYVESCQLFFSFLKIIALSSIITNYNDHDGFYYFFIYLLILDLVTAITNSLILINLYQCDYQYILRALESLEQQRIQLQYSNDAYTDFLTLLEAMSNRYQYVYNTLASCYLFLSIYCIILLAKNYDQGIDDYRASSIALIILAICYFIRKLILKIRLHKRLQIYNIVNLSPRQQDDDCCICLQSLSENVALLKCTHKFHQLCINEWLKTKNTCPICKREYETIQSYNL